MNIEEADPASRHPPRRRQDRLFPRRREQSRLPWRRGHHFDPIFDALLDIGYDRDLTFESFSSAIVDEALSLACAIWRDTWNDNVPLAKHAKSFIELKWAEAARRRATNARP